MDSQEAIDFGREALIVALQIGGPILLVALVAGLIIGFLQAITQIHDGTVATIPRMIIVLVAIGLCLPWLTSQIVDYTQAHWQMPISLQTTEPFNQ